MKEILYKCSVFLLLIIALFPSCNNVRKENNDKLVTEMIDSMNVYKEKRDGKKMIFLIDSLKSLEVNIEDISLWYATAYAFDGDYDRAIQLLKDSVATSAKPQLLYHELGNIYLGKGDTVQAIIAYKQAIDCNPNYARLYLGIVSK